jgi:hypothetical protein
LSARWLNILTAAALVALLAVLSLTAPIWSRMLRRPVAGAEEETVPSPSPRADASSSPEARRTIKVKLYFEAAERPGLQAEEREVLYSDDISRQLRNVVEALVAGSSTGLVAPLPPATRVLDVFVTAQGTAYVDLSAEVRQAAPPAPPSASPATPPAPPRPKAASSHAELMAVYSIVDTLAVNFPAVKQVQIMVDGQAVRSLWSHVDVGRPLRPDLSLMAGSETTPGGGPWSEPALASPGPSAAPAPVPSRAPQAAP